MFRLLTFLLLLLPSFAAAHAQPAECASLSGELTVGLWGRVASDSANNLRQEPTTSAPILRAIPAGDIFRITGEPQCADGYVWWQVDYIGTTGWTAEGSMTARSPWLAPLAGQAETVEYPDDPAGCARPPDDYTRFNISFATVNLRTLAMLDHAQQLYRAGGGVINLRSAIMQGSYNPGRVAASFGTHDGGGALDLSVRDPISRAVLAAEIQPMLAALRLAGFAAWLRDTDSLYPGSPIHIHAIAIGDDELSEAARDQIDGQFGYLRGYDGLPRDDGIPQPDTSGDMILCGWMIDQGFTDLRAETANPVAIVNRFL